jgi:hypothetical protein
MDEEKNNDDLTEIFKLPTLGLVRECYEVEMRNLLDESNEQLEEELLGEGKKITAKYGDNSVPGEKNYNNPEENYNIPQVVGQDYVAKKVRMIADELQKQHNEKIDVFEGDKLIGNYKITAKYGDKSVSSAIEQSGRLATFGSDTYDRKPLWDWVDHRDVGKVRNVPAPDFVQRVVDHNYEPVYPSTLCLPKPKEDIKISPFSKYMKDELYYPVDVKRILFTRRWRFYHPDDTRGMNWFWRLYSEIDDFLIMHHVDITPYLYKYNLMYESFLQMTSPSENYIHMLEEIILGKEVKWVSVYEAWVTLYKRCTEGGPRY